MGVLHIITRTRTSFTRAHPRVDARVEHSCQAGREGEDTHLTCTHTCAHTHRDSNPGAYHGGPGSCDAREDPPADAEAAGGDPAEEQRGEGKTPALLLLAFNFVSSSCVTTTDRACTCVIERVGF